MGRIEGSRITVCYIRQVVSIFHVTSNVTFDMPMSSFMHDLEKPQKEQDQQHAHEESCRDAIDA
jgi:hypothetical protein